jgi:hydroxymethylpyrimidine pyrophosphatase-like HAD family hydrolase
MFQGIVFDYDGTLCDPRDRFAGVLKEVANSLQSLLRQKILVGIATGRGKSVRDSLRNAMDKSLWNSILIGYYNGSDIGSLDDDMHPIRKGPIDPSLKTFMSRLRNNPYALKLVDIEQRPKQISLQPRLPLTVDELVSSVSSIAKRDDSQTVRIVTSSHSVDLLAPGVSKVHIVEAIQKMLTRKDAPVLCIGDKGEWPGNDFELLSGQYSLSVDSVSSDPGSCWNLAPPGYRGVRATLAYLDALDIKNRSFAFAYSRLRYRDA